MRAGAMRANAVHDDIHRVRTGVGIVLLDRDLARRVTRRDVKGQRIIRRAEASPDIVVAHCADRTPPVWAVEALEELPKLMGAAANADALAQFTARRDARSV